MSEEKTATFRCVGPCETGACGDPRCDHPKRNGLQVPAGSVPESTHAAADAEGRHCACWWEVPFGPSLAVDAPLTGVGVLSLDDLSRRIDNAEPRPFVPAQRPSPGPWRIERLPVFPAYIADARGIPVCDMHMPERSLGEGGHYEADARLIAAAPELAEALRAVMGIYDHPIFNDDLNAEEREHMDRARALLARIDGKKTT